MSNSSDTESDHNNEDSVETLISTDPGQWPPTLTRNVIDTLVLRGPSEIKDIKFPPDANNRRFSVKHSYRFLQNGQKIAQMWLIYSEASDKIYCFSCKLYDNNPLSSLAVNGCSDWIHVGEILKTHERAKSHF